jgi:hypothetical protein
MIEDVLLQQAQQKQLATLTEMGLDPNSEEAKQQLDPEKLKVFYYKKDDWVSIYNR